MPKNLPHSITWILIATIAMAATIWQVPHSAIYDLKAYSPAPPLKTRHTIRAADSPELCNPLADYLGRCQKGLTEREIRWIVQDFQNAGLDLGHCEASREACLALRKAQHRWYRDALTDGLRLSPEQSNQVAENLAKHFDQAENDLTQNPTAESMTKFVSANDWLGGDSPALKPSGLCTLAPEQQTVLQQANRGYSLSAVSALFGTSQIFHLQKAAPPSQLQPAGTVLPFTRQQAFTSPPNPLDTRTDQSAETLVSQVRCLHPGQLKMLLLFEPAMAVQIQQALAISER